MSGTELRPVRLDDLSVDDLEATGGKLNPEQRQACPSGQRRNNEGVCVPKVAKSEELVQKSVQVTRNVKILKTDDAKRLVFGEVYAPNVPDTQGDFMLVDDIEQMAHQFMVARRQKMVDENHDNEETDTVIVESFIVREGDPDFPMPGAWVVGAHVIKDEVWERVVDGTLNGFSMEAMVTKTIREVTVELEEEIDLTTAPGPNGHTHEAQLNFDSEGNFRGGQTSEVDGHWHDITGNTTTGAEVRVDGKPGDGHEHRYSFVEFLHIVADVGDPNNTDPSRQGEPQV